jgi:two-component system sensor histidine kinase/response regulator
MKEIVLLLDDDITLLESLVDFLTLSDFEVMVGHSGVEGLEKLKKNQPDIIICDIMMPQMDGYEFFTQVRQNQKWVSIPFIFLSAKGEIKDILAGYTLGADHYITKPFDPDELLVMVKAHLERTKEIRIFLNRQIKHESAREAKVLNSELQGPLELVNTYLKTYQRELDRLEPDRAKQLSGLMTGTLNTMVRLLEDLMLITYIDSGAVQVEIHSLYQPLDLVEELQEVLAQAKETASKKEISLVTFFPASLEIHGHAHFIRDIFYRLLENALKFSQPGGNIWLEAKILSENVVVTIRDEGMGISEEQKKELFSRLQDPDRIKIEKQGGGLGLAIAARLARLHGGEIQVESKLGKGSTFTVILPLNLGLD